MPTDLIASETAPILVNALDRPQHVTKHRDPSGKVRRALEIMVYEGAKRDDAAKLAGLKPKSLYHAFQQAHVKAYFARQLEVLRTSARARNIHRLEEMRDQDENKMAVVQAIKTLEQLDEAPNTSAATLRAPGVVIIIERPAAPRQIDHQAAIEAKPLNHIEAVPDDE